MDIILIGGLWLDASVWDDVAAHLRGYGHRPVPLALPGVADRSATATLDEQVAAAVAAVDSADRPMVVGHSAACSLAWMAADRRPDAIERVVMVGGFPRADGELYADFFETVDGAMPFPGWEPFDGADSADLDTATKERIAASAIPVPEAVSKGIVRLADERRFDVPVTLVCPEYTPEQAQTWIKEGHVPELAAARHVTFVDIDSGHWPMISRPADLARILDLAAAGA
ncbi:MAG: alpha/beta hydrolase [Micromonosporaceae bacterium]